MSVHHSRPLSLIAPFLPALLLAVLVGSRTGAAEQEKPDTLPPSIVYKIQGPNDRLELTVNSSRMLSLDRAIPRVQVGDQSLLTVTPVSAKQVQIHAKKPGVTQVNLWDDQDQIYTVDVMIFADVRELSTQLKTQFPNSVITVYPTPNSIILKGFIDNPADVKSIIQIAQEYHPKVIDNMRVGGSQQVLLHVTVAEVNRTKLRDLGVDFVNVSPNGSFARSSISGLLSGNSVSGFATSGAETFAYGIVDASNSFFSALAAMQRNQLMKVLAEPTLQTISGRPAYFQSGGEIPILIPQSLGTVSVEYRQFGTQVDFVPIVLGNGNVRLEVRPQVTELDNSIAVTLNGSRIPGFRSRRIDTGAELKFGQTLALAGLIQTRTDSTKIGVPWLSDIPYIGVPFGRMTETVNEVELLIMVRPELSEPLDPEQVPCLRPGDATTSPRDWDFYMRRYMEVPKYNPNADGVMGPSPSHPAEEVREPEPAARAPGRSVPRMAKGTASRPPAAQPGMTQPVPPQPPLPPASARPATEQRAEPVRTANRTGTSQPSAVIIGPADAPTQATEAAGASPARKDRNTRSNPQERPISAPTNRKSEGPGLIGPVGYDLSN